MKTNNLVAAGQWISPRIGDERIKAEKRGKVDEFAVPRSLWQVDAIFLARIASS
ncbi:MAG: hypothetical protein P8N94_15485 [Gammaproteobacteria bacterium]|nr:hypothetical protein [Gammaproteobacteria bacterium]